MFDFISFVTKDIPFSNIDKKKCESTIGMILNMRKNAEISKNGFVYMDRVITSDDRDITIDKVISNNDVYRNFCNLGICLIEDATEPEEVRFILQCNILAGKYVGEVLLRHLLILEGLLNIQEGKDPRIIENKLYYIWGNYPCVYHKDFILKYLLENHFSDKIKEKCEFTIETIVKLCNLTRMEGIVGLNNVKREFDLGMKKFKQFTTDCSDDFLHDGILLLLSATDATDVEEAMLLLQRKIVDGRFTGVALLERILLLEGFIYIGNGTNPRIVRKLLESMLTKNDEKKTIISKVKQKFN